VTALAVGLCAAALAHGWPELVAAQGGEHAQAEPRSEARKARARQRRARQRAKQTATAPSAAGQALPLTAAPIDLVDDGSIAAEPLQHPPAPEPKPAPPTAPAPPLSAAASAEGPSVHAARASAPPSIDGKLDDAVWSSAPPSAAFTQKAPYPGRPATDATTLRVLYDDDAIYVGLECEQVHSPIIGRLTRRDRPAETDSVAIAIDSRGDGWSAFEFSISAAGVLLDGLRFDDGKISREWDAIWEGQSARTAHGWSAELRIPRPVLRFEPRAGAAYQVQARRYISARQEIDEWAYIPSGAGAEVSRYGRLEGIARLDHDSSFELAPFVLARAEHWTADPAFVRSGWGAGASAGLDFKWQASSALVWNGTINPDFGQVEADVVLLNLTTSELSLPEKRPFFLAGMDDFSTPASLFYSRRIGRTPAPPPPSNPPARLQEPPQASPIYGALKLAWERSSDFSVAALSALTGANDVRVVQQNGAEQLRLLDPLSSYNVLRIRTQPASGFELGAIGTATLRNEPGSGWPSWITSSGEYPALPGSPARVRCPQGELVASDERCFHDAYVAGLDLVWRSPQGEYAVRGQAYGSAIENGPTRQLADGTHIQSGDLGAGGTLRLSKQGGEHWLLDATFAAHSRKLDFDDLGFMERQNELRGGAYVEYRTLAPWLMLLETHSSALAYAANNLDGLALARGLLLMEHLVFDGGWTFTLGAYGNTRRYDDREVGDGTALERAALLGSMQAVSTDTRAAWVGTAQLSEEWLENGANWSAQLGLNWQPASMLELQLLATYTYNFGEPRYAGTGEDATDLVFGRLAAESAGVTLRLSYTFTPTLSLQTFGQLFLARGSYDDFGHFQRAPVGPSAIVHLADLVPGPFPPGDPDFQSASLAVNVVLRWEYALGSTLYLLYVRSQNPSISPDPEFVPRLDAGVLRSAPASDVLMIKLAYWIG
jgi:hypothetical protein